ncbi:MAG: 3-oxoadipate enol-lactonase [Thermodesulfobacteriota bacterium]
MPLAKINKTTLHYRFDGPEQGTVVMFSNSLASNLQMWDAQIPALVQAGYRTLRYDSRGHGQSAATPGPYSMEMLTADALGLMDLLDLERVHFCGLSMGGMVGQMLGTHHNNRLISLTLCDTAAQLPPREMWDERIKTVRAKGMRALADAFIDRWFTKAGQKRLPAEIERSRQAIVNTPAEGFCACCHAIQHMDQRESIRGISVRTLIVVGEHDPGTPVSAAEFIHSRIAASELKVISDAAHFVNVEQAGVFNAALLEFLNRNNPVS